MNTTLKNIVCTKCGCVNEQIKKGYTVAGSQRYFCKICGNKYTPFRKKDYTEEMKQRVVKTYLYGTSARGTGRIFNIDGNTVIAWVKKIRASRMFRSRGCYC